jgi:hypothetical protein
MVSANLLQFLFKWAGEYHLNPTTRYVWEMARIANHGAPEIQRNRESSIFSSLWLVSNRFFVACALVSCEWFANWFVNPVVSLLGQAKLVLSNSAPRELPHRSSRECCDLVCYSNFHPKVSLFMNQTCPDCIRFPSSERVTIGNCLGRWTANNSTICSYTWFLFYPSSTDSV